MKTIQERRLEILNWEKDNRNFNNRSVSDESGLCVYSGPIGCGVGRLIEDKDLCYNLDKSPFSAVPCIFSFLPKDVRELGEDFLCSVQLFHDRKANWNENGLTSIGMKTYDCLKKTYCS